MEVAVHVLGSCRIRSQSVRSRRFSYDGGRMLRRMRGVHRSRCSGFAYESVVDVLEEAGVEMRSLLS